MQIGAKTREMTVMEKAKTLKRVRRILARAAGAKVIKAKTAMTTDRPVTLPMAPWERPKFKSVRGEKT